MNAQARLSLGGVAMDQGQLEVIGFLAVAVVGPVVAVLRMVRRMTSPGQVFAVTWLSIWSLSTVAAAAYGVLLRLTLRKPEMNWTALAQALPDELVATCRRSVVTKVSDWFLSRT